MDAAAQLGAAVRLALDLVDDGLSAEEALAEAHRRVAAQLDAGMSSPLPEEFRRVS